MTTETADVAQRKRIIRLHLLYRAVRDLLRLRLASAISTLRLLRRGSSRSSEAVGVLQVLELVLREIDWRALRFAFPFGVC